MTRTREILAREQSVEPSLVTMELGAGDYFVVVDVARTAVALFVPRVAPVVLVVEDTVHVDVDVDVEHQYHPS